METHWLSNNEWRAAELLTKNEILRCVPDISRTEIYVAAKMENVELPFPDVYSKVINFVFQ